MTARRKLARARLTESLTEVVRDIELADRYRAIRRLLAQPGEQRVSEAEVFARIDTLISLRDGLSSGEPLAHLRALAAEAGGETEPPSAELAEQRQDFERIMARVHGARSARRRLLDVAHALGPLADALISDGHSDLAAKLRALAETCAVDSLPAGAVQRRVCLCDYEDCDGDGLWLAPDGTKRCHYHAVDTAICELPDAERAAIAAANSPTVLAWREHSCALANVDLALQGRPPGGRVYPAGVPVAHVVELATTMRAAVLGLGSQITAGWTRTEHTDGGATWVLWTHGERDADGTAARSIEIRIDDSGPDPETLEIAEEGLGREWELLEVSGGVDPDTVLRILDLERVRGWSS